MSSHFLSYEEVILATAISKITGYGLSPEEHNNKVVVFGHMLKWKKFQLYTSKKGQDNHRGSTGFVL